MQYSEKKRQRSKIPVKYQELTGQPCLNGTEKKIGIAVLIVIKYFMRQCRQDGTCGRGSLRKTQNAAVLVTNFTKGYQRWWGGATSH